MSYISNFSNIGLLNVGRSAASDPISTSKAFKNSDLSEYLLPLSFSRLSGLHLESASL